MLAVTLLLFCACVYFAGEGVSAPLRTASDHCLRERPPMTIPCACSIERNSFWLLWRMTPLRSAMTRQAISLASVCFLRSVHQLHSCFSLYLMRLQAPCPVLESISETKLVMGAAECGARPVPSKLRCTHFTTHSALLAGAASSSS